MRSQLMLYVTVILVLGTVPASGQSASTLAATGFQNVDGNVFYRLSADGGTLLANRSANALGEELVTVSTAGGSETVWHTAEGRWIYNRIALSGDGGTVAYARSPGSIVYALTEPLGTPRVVVNVAPDSDPRELQLSADGKWVAFTASRLVQTGSHARIHANLYVAATDGSVVHLITASPLPDRRIAFDLSPDGAWISWIDDAAKGPMIAAVGGASATRLALDLGADHVTDVSWNADASRLYYHTLSGGGVAVGRVQRNGTGAEELHSAARGRYGVARTGEIRLSQFDPSASPAGTSWRLGGSGLTATYHFGRPDIAGTEAWSADGKVCVWRAPMATGRSATWVWRAGS